MPEIAGLDIVFEISISWVMVVFVLIVVATKGGAGCGVVEAVKRVIQVAQVPSLRSEARAHRPRQ